MLGKLMKYELKATSRLLIPLYSVLLVISLINRLAFTRSDARDTFTVFSQFLAVTYVSSIFVILVVTFIYMIVRFYKNLLTDEGYLMFTLPVKTHELITSKLLITLLWAIVSFVGVGISLFVTFAAPDTIPLVLEGIREAIAEINRELGGTSWLIFAELIVMSLLGMISQILMIYVSIAVGQLFSKHKVIGSFVAYMGIYTGIQFLMMILIIPSGIFISKTQIEASIIPNLIFPVSIVILLMGCAGFYFTTHYILKRKLNLD